MEECKSADVVSLSSWAPYGLKQLPFTQHTEYRMYAMPHIWFRVLRSLQSFLRGTQVLAVFTGAHGVGKRSLLQQWLRYGRVKMPLIHIMPTQQMQPLQFIEILAENCDLSLQVDKSVSVAFKELMQRLSKKGKCHVLMLDCIERLPLASVAVLAEILRLQPDDAAFFKIIVTLDKERSGSVLQLFDDVLASSSILKINMQPGSLADTRSYMRHRLRAAGLGPAYELADAAVAKVYELSAGLPEKINKIVSCYRPQDLLAPVVMSAEKIQTTDGLINRLKRLVTRHNIQAYAIGLLMSSSMVFLIMQRPGLVPGARVGKSFHTLSLNSVADAGMSGMHPGYDFFDSEKSFSIVKHASFALQLAVLPSARAARDFLWKHKLEGRAYYWLHESAGQRWAAVLLGSYTTKQQAETALAQLPKSILKFKPAVRHLPKHQTL